MPYQPKEVLNSIDEVRQIIDGIHPAQRLKILDHIDIHCRNWIERSPFVVISTSASDGRLDCSPKGDPAGFVKVLDRHTLAVPDRPGNHRFDGFQNIFETGQIGIVFFVPNRNEVVRVNGTAKVVRDTSLRESMAIKGRIPEFAIVVSVQEAFFHCGKAIIRSGLWHPAKAAPTDGLPTYAQAIHDQSQAEVSFDALDARLKHNDANRLYDE